MTSTGLRCLRSRVASRLGYSPQKRTLLTRYVNCEPMITAAEFTIQCFRSRRPCPPLARFQSVWKSICCVAPSNTWLFASMNFGDARHQPIKGGSVAMNLKSVDTDYRSARIYNGYQKKWAIMDWHTILNGPSSENFNGQFRPLSSQLSIRKCRAHDGGNSTHRTPEFPTHAKYPDNETNECVRPIAGWS